MILLDTSVLLSFDELDVPDDAYVSSAVVLAELEFGVAVSRSAGQYNQRRARLMRVRQTGIQWLPFTDATATFHAELMSLIHPHAPGKARARDIMIAATACELGARLATRNRGDFVHLESRLDIVVPRDLEQTRP